MISRYKKIEDVLKIRATKVIKSLSHILGVEVTITKKSTIATDETDVYGMYARRSPEAGGTTKIRNILFVGENLAPISDFQVGSLQEGLLYDPEDDVEVGDLITINREDGRKRQFQVYAPESYGNMVNILKRFKLASISGEI